MSTKTPDCRIWRKRSPDEPLSPALVALHKHAEEIAKIAGSTSSEEMAEILKNAPPTPGAERYRTPSNPMTRLMFVD